MKHVKTILLAVLAGLVIGIGGAVFLSVESKVLGSVLFTVGLFAICTMGFNLFTGKVCYSIGAGASYLLTLAEIWAGNFVGTFFAAKLFSLTRIAGISEKAMTMCDVKLNDSLLSIFILAIFCNILIYIAVDGYKNNPHELGKYLALFFGVVVFILCGFEHCIANMFYISMANAWNATAFVFLIVNTLGNAVGGLLIPVVKLIANKESAAK